VAGTNPGTTNLVAWWSLDETSGTRVDSHGSNDLTDNNTVGFAAGVQGNAADFESTNTEYLDITSPVAALRGGNKDFTIGGWIKLESRNTWCHVLSVYTSGEREYFVTDDGTYLHAYLGDGSLLWVADAASASLSTATWYFWVVWHDTSGPSWNIQTDDGSVTSDTTFGGTPGTGTSALRMGTSNFDGLQDECFYYERVLTADERTWLYNGGSGRAYSDLSAGGVPLPVLMSGAVRVG